MTPVSYKITPSDLTLLLIGVILLISACASPPTATSNKGPRTIVLNGQQFSEELLGEFISWGCHEYFGSKHILLEVGILPNTDSDSPIRFGFILYDGGHSGDFAFYQRKGINHRWDWGPNGEYAFVVKPDGTGLFYDFSNTPDGKSTTTNDAYKCNRLQ